MIQFVLNVTGDGVEGSIPYSQLVAGLLRDIGIVKCNMGDMAAGCQLMEESAKLYEWKPSSSYSVGEDEKSAAISNSRRATKVAEVILARIRNRYKIGGKIKLFRPL